MCFYLFNRMLRSRYVDCYTCQKESSFKEQRQKAHPLEYKTLETSRSVVAIKHTSIFLPSRCFFSSSPSCNSEQRGVDAALHLRNVLLLLLLFSSSLTHS